MSHIIKSIIEESRCYRYPENIPHFKLNEAKKLENIEKIKTSLAQIDELQEKALAYEALASVGRICGVDQSTYILDDLLKDKRKKLISETLTGFSASEVPIINRFETLKYWSLEKSTDLRQSAISAMKLCEPEWPLAEIFLMDYFSRTTNKNDLFWIIYVFMERGTNVCLSTLRAAIDRITDGDGIVFTIRAALRIDATNMADFFLNVFEKYSDTHIRKEALNGLVASGQPIAVEQIIERTKKILSKKHPGYFVDYLDSHSELQAAMMYLQLFRNENMSINELFEWIKTKRMDYMDAPTRKWAEKNI